MIAPPETFKLDTTKLEDGRHTLVLKAIDEDGATSGLREMQFAVRNGPGIAVHGIRDGDLVAGEISVLANAYSSTGRRHFRTDRASRRRHRFLRGPRHLISSVFASGDVVSGDDVQGT